MNSNQDLSDKQGTDDTSKKGLLVWLREIQVLTWVYIVLITGIYMYTKGERAGLERGVWMCIEEEEGYDPAE